MHKKSKFEPNVAAAAASNQSKTYRSHTFHVGPNNADCYNVDLGLLTDCELIGCVNVSDLANGLRVHLDALTF